MSSQFAGEQFKAYNKSGFCNAVQQHSRTHHEKSISDFLFNRSGKL
jgi:hypothetical protein